MLKRHLIRNGIFFSTTTFDIKRREYYGFGSSIRVPLLFNYYFWYIDKIQFTFR